MLGFEVIRRISSHLFLASAVVPVFMVAPILAQDAASDRAVERRQVLEAFARGEDTSQQVKALADEPSPRRSMNDRESAVADDLAEAARALGQAARAPQKSGDDGMKLRYAAERVLAIDLLM